MCQRSAANKCPFGLVINMDPGNNVHMKSWAFASIYRFYPIMKFTNTADSVNPREFVSHAPKP